MSISVAESVLRCFRKFGANVHESGASRQAKWHHSSAGRPSISRFSAKREADAEPAEPVAS